MESYTITLNGVEHIITKEMIHSSGLSGQVIDKLYEMGVYPEMYRGMKEVRND